MSVLPDHSPRDQATGRPGLRERKKARTRAAIREHAFRLFREQGYEATTVEQIAAAAEVSPSTFFRYFPTKEDVVLQDDMDLMWAEAVKAQPPELPPIAALRAAMPAVFTSLTPEQLALLAESAQLAVSVPAVRSRFLDEFGRTIQVIGEAIAERTGRSPDDRAVRTLAGAMMGIATAAWFATSSLPEMMEEFSQGLDLLEKGIPL